MSEEQGDVPSSPEIHFEPIVTLPLVELKTLEENEEVLFQMRAKLYRYESAGDPPEWKERGTGELKILKHKTEDHVRIIMRRDKTLKICANHYIQSYMELKPNSSSDRAWVYSVLADFADELPKPELFAIKFANVENAQKFKEAFNEAKSISSAALNKTLGDSLKDESTSDDSSSANSTPVKVTPVKKETPVKVTPDKKETPVKVTSDKKETPVKVTPDKKETPVKNTDEEKLTDKLSNLKVEENQNSESTEKDTSDAKSEEK